MKQSGTRRHGSATLVRSWLAEEDEHRRVRKGRKGEQQREREEEANAEHEGEGEALHVGHETQPAQLTPEAIVDTPYVSPTVHMNKIF